MWVIAWLALLGLACVSPPAAVVWLVLMIFVFLIEVSQ